MSKLSRLLAVVLVFLSSAFSACNRDSGRDLTGPDQVTGSTRSAIGEVTVADITLFGATVSWVTSEASDSLIEVTSASSGVASPSSWRQDTYVTNHSLRITTLSPHTTYTLRVTSKTVQGQTATSAMRTFTTDGAEGSPDVSLAITSFTVIEYQYPGDPIWYYAPQIKVRETSSSGVATVVKMSVSVPGLGASPPFFTKRCIAAGQETELLHESYGDWEYSVFSTTRRSTGGSATAELTFTDDRGRQAVVKADGAIVSGGPPLTYTGGGSWPCGK